jgi:hypothetical protein
VPAFGADRHGLGIDPDDLGAESCLDLPRLDPIHKVRAEPVLDAVLEGGAAINQGDLRAGPVAGQGLLGRRILPTDDHHPQSGGEVRLRAVMGYVRQGLAGHAEQIGMVEIAGGEHQAIHGEPLFPETGRETADQATVLARRADEPRVGPDPSPSLRATPR